MSRADIGKLILRLGLSAVYLWFGFSQLFDSVSWVGIVPEWAVNMLHLPPAMIVLGNGLMEVVLGALLIIGFRTSIVASILTIHLAVIASHLGFSATGVRDLGLTMATLALVFLNLKEKSPAV